MQDIDTDSYWNDPLLAIMLKPSMDRDTLSRSGGELESAALDERIRNAQQARLARLIEVQATGVVAGTHANGDEPRLTQYRLTLLG